VKKTPELLQTRPTVADRRAALRILNWVHFLYLFFFSGMEFTLTFLTYDLFDFTNMQNGKLLGYIGILSAVIQGGYVRRRAHTIGEKTLVMQGVGACGIALAILAFLKWTSNGVVWLYLGSTFLAFTSATVVNCLTTLASLQCDDYESADASKGEQRRRTETIAKGQALGSFRSFGQLGRAIGPIAACGLYWMAGSEICYGAGAAAMVIILGIVTTHVPSISKVKMA
jgi:MFS family permease